MKERGVIILTYKTLFEAEPINIVNAILLLLISMAVIILAICVLGYLCYKRHTKQKTSIFYISALIGLLLYCVYGLVQIPIQKTKIYEEYINGEFYVKEGSIHIIYNEKNIEHYYFMIDDITFSLDNRQAYNYSCTDDDLCVYDGQYVKISYIKYRNKNLIMKIEIPITSDY